MATRKATIKKTSDSKKTAAVSARNKSTKKESPKEESKREEAPRKIFAFLRNAKTLYIIAILLGLAALLALGSRYLVVAWVDNKPITRFEFYKSLDQKYGKDVKEQLIVERLIEEEAIKRGVRISDNDMNNEISKIEKEQGGKEKLDQILQIQNISNTEFRKLVRLQLLRQKMFGQNIEVKEDEVKKFLEENKEQFPEVNDQVRNQVKEQLKQQKLGADFNKWLQDTLKSPRVKRV